MSRESSISCLTLLFFLSRAKLFSFNPEPTATADSASRRNLQHDTNDLTSTVAVGSGLNEKDVRLRGRRLRFPNERKHGRPQGDEAHADQGFRSLRYEHVGQDQRHDADIKDRRHRITNASIGPRCIRETPAERENRRDGQRLERDTRRTSRNRSSHRTGSFPWGHSRQSFAQRSQM